jgi:uncharacterized membrane protein YidH (DUF202 family)
MFNTANEVKKELARHHADILAIGRTVMANIRTSIGLLGGGIGLVALLEHPVFVAVGWLSMALSVVVLIYGIRRFLQIRGMMIELLRRN